MTMWFPLEKDAALGEDPSRPSDFIYHIPEYDNNGNLVSGHPDYFLDRGDSRFSDQPSSRNGNSAQGTHGVGTSFKGGVDAPGPAEFIEREPQWDGPAAWGPDLIGEKSPYPYPPAEQLKRDTAFALGEGKSFQWPGGQESAENGHNIVNSRGFALENSGTDNKPIPSYVHAGTRARIEPSGDEDAPWQLSSPHLDPDSGEPYGTTMHTSAGAAAMAHQSQLNDIEAKHAQRRVEEARSRSYLDNGPSSRSRSRSPRRPRGIPGSRPKNVDDAMRHAVGTASYLTGDEAHKASWDLLNQGTTFGGHPDHLYSRRTGMLNDWVASQYHNDLEAGKVQHVIYHHATPLAWLKVEATPEDPEKHTWVIPDDRYSNTSSRRQSAIDYSIRRTGHGDAVETPYDPARGFPDSHLRSGPSGSGYSARSHNAQSLVGQLGEQGFTRPKYNSRQKAIFIRPTTQTHEDHYPDQSYGWRTTHTHGVYLRPVDGPRGAAWVVGEHDNGTNKIAGSKRLDSLSDALAHADRMHRWINDGAQGEAPVIADRSDAAFRRDIRRRRGLDAPIPRAPAQVLPGQEELPFHSSSVHQWSQFLRD